jgi:hypothetical protein
LKRVPLVLISLALLLAAACGHFLPFGSADEEPPPSDHDEDAAADVRTAEGGNTVGGETSDADASGADGGIPTCIPSKQCADAPLECCSLTRGSQCPVKCEITCCQ